MIAKTFLYNIRTIYVRFDKGERVYQADECNKINEDGDYCIIYGLKSSSELKFYCCVGDDEIKPEFNREHALDLMKSSGIQRSERNENFQEILDLLS